MSALSRFVGWVCLTFVMSLAPDLASAPSTGVWANQPDSAGTPPTTWDAATVRGLRERLDGLLLPLARQRLAVSLRVVALPSGQVLYSLNPEGLPLTDANGQPTLRPLIPASNMKLVTTAAALDRLGAAHRFRTVFGRLGPNDLAVIGDGDPAFGDPAIEGVTRDTDEFARWAAALKAAGVSEIPGALVIDDSVFDRQWTCSGWPGDQLVEWFCAPVGGLNFHTNCVEVWPVQQAGGTVTARVRPANDWVRVTSQVRGGAVAQIGLHHGAAPGEIIMRGTWPANARSVGYEASVTDPGAFFGAVLLRTLSEAGIRVAGGLQRARLRDARGQPPANLTPLAVYETPLPVVITRCNKRSQNLYAECLFKTLGRTVAAPDSPPDTAGVGSWATGQSAVMAFLDKLHLPAESAQAVLTDGSGLSRDNALTAMLLTEVLRYMHGHPDFAVYANSLPVAGEDGTLAKRLTDPKTRGQILAKTGYIRGVTSLSGYVRTPPHQPGGGHVVLAFSMLTNDVRGSTGPVKAIEDHVAAELARLAARAAPHVGAVSAHSGAKSR